MRLIEVAERIGIERQTAYRSEWGQREPPFEELEKYAALFDARIGWLLTGELPAPSYLTDDVVDEEEGAVCQAG